MLEKIIDQINLKIQEIETNTETKVTKEYEKGYIDALNWFSDLMDDIEHEELIKSIFSNREEK